MSCLDFYPSKCYFHKDIMLYYLIDWLIKYFSGSGKCLTLSEAASHLRLASWATTPLRTSRFCTRDPGTTLTGQRGTRSQISPKRSSTRSSSQTYSHFCSERESGKNEKNKTFWHVRHTKLMTEVKQRWAWRGDPREYDGCSWKVFLHLVVWSGLQHLTLTSSFRMWLSKSGAKDLIEIPI